jgi:hypothetical protein
MPARITSESDPEVSEAPKGFYKLQTRRGRVVCFSCSTCGLLIRGLAEGTKFFHCGKTEKSPHFTILLPTRHLGAGPEPFIRLGTWDVNEDDFAVER